MALKAKGQELCFVLSLCKVSRQVQHICLEAQCLSAQFPKKDNYNFKSVLAMRRSNSLEDVSSDKSCCFKNQIQICFPYHLPLGDLWKFEWGEEE